MLRLARAFERRGEGELAFVGDGPLRPALEGRPESTLAGPVDHDRVAAGSPPPTWSASPASPSRSGSRRSRVSRRGRSVVATRIGGPPEFVPPEAGVLVDPLDDDAVRAALDAAACLPRPNPAARRAAEAHDVRRQAERVEELLSCCSFSRSASLSSTSGRTVSSSPAARAASSAAS